MNTPNKLTILRVLLVPVFLIFMLVEGWGWHLAGLGIFILASVTDAIDGHLARKNNQITVFGKFMDPLADKVLTTAAFLILLYEDMISPWAVMLILAREFMVSGVRLAAVGEGQVIAASIWGKAKTVAQMIAVIVSLLIMNLPGIPESLVFTTVNVLVWISVGLTVLSGVDYLMKNKSLLKLK